MSRYQTHCKRNHPMVDRNLYWYRLGSRTKFNCRKCAVIRGKRSYRRRLGWLLSTDVDVLVEPGAIRHFPLLEQPFYLNERSLGAGEYPASPCGVDPGVVDGDSPGEPAVVAAVAPSLIEAKGQSHHVSTGATGPDREGV